MTNVETNGRSSLNKTIKKHLNAVGATPLETTPDTGHQITK